MSYIRIVWRVEITCFPSWISFGSHDVASALGESWKVAERVGDEEPLRRPNFEVMVVKTGHLPSEYHGFMRVYEDYEDLIGFYYSHWRRGKHIFQSMGWYGVAYAQTNHDKTILYRWYNDFPVLSFHGLRRSLNQRKRTTSWPTFPNCQRKKWSFVWKSALAWVSNRYSTSCLT